jgi:hypothetical protein
LSGYFYQGRYAPQALRLFEQALSRYLLSARDELRSGTLAKVRWLTFGDPDVDFDQIIALAGKCPQLVSVQFAGVVIQGQFEALLMARPKLGTLSIGQAALDLERLLNLLETTPDLIDLTLLNVTDSNDTFALWLASQTVMETAGRPERSPRTVLLTQQPGAETPLSSAQSGAASSRATTAESLPTAAGQGDAASASGAQSGAAATSSGAAAEESAPTAASTQSEAASASSAHSGAAVAESVSAAGDKVELPTVITGDRMLLKWLTRTADNRFWESYDGEAYSSFYILVGRYLLAQRRIDPRVLDKVELLRFDAQADFDAICSLVAKCPKLRSVSIEQLTEDQLDRLVSACPHLRTLNVFRAGGLGQERLLACLKQRPALEYLMLTGASHLNPFLTQLTTVGRDGQTARDILIQ